MTNLVIFGPPGSGKGTQSQGLAERYGITIISTGEILRNEMKQDTPLGRKAKTFIDQGQLVPDEVIIEMIEGILKKKHNDKGYLFDGFPRTVVQAEAFDKMLAQLGYSVSALLELAVADEEVTQRLLKRKEIEGRSDDNLETIKNRLEVYHKQTQPIVQHYAQQGKHHQIDGVGTIEEVAKRLYAAIDASL